MTHADEWLKVESLDLEAQGVAHNADGKVVFIEDALPGEEVQVRVLRRKNNWEQAQVSVRRRDSSQGAACLIGPTAGRNASSTSRRAI